MRPAASLAFAALLTSAALARADDAAFQRARDAYDRGVRAHAAGDHAAAARAFAEADALAPAAASLEAAIESAMRADDAVLGVELLERLEGRPPEASLDKTVQVARRRFAGRTGKIRVDCMGEARCLVSVDGVGADASRAFVVKVGPHAVAVERGSARFEKLVEVGPDATVLVSGPDPAPKPALRTRPEAPRAAPSGISPAWFYLGLGLTAIAGGVTTWSGLDALAAHDRFADDGCGPGGSGPVPADCAARADSGEARTLRTNVLMGVTAALAVTTALTGAFFVRWSAAPSSAGLAIGGKLP